MGKSTTTSISGCVIALVATMLLASSGGVAAQGGGGYAGYGHGGYGYDYGQGHGQLIMGYYWMSCPYAEAIVRNVVGEALYKDPTLAASLLRLHFHDCFVRGCDASVLLDSTHGSTAEKDALPNKSLRGFEVIDAVKEALEARCPGIVSCADVLALAARDSVSMAGGPYYDVPTGRRDGFHSLSADTSALPAATLTAPKLIDLFVGTHGFTVPELVALSGAHTLGRAHCANFKNRLKANAVDPTMDAWMAASLVKTCKRGGDGAIAKLDTTSNAFDTDYFLGLLHSRGLLTSDQTLMTGSEETVMYVGMFADNSDIFFDTFVQGMAKMGQLDLNPYGNVRMNCRVLNY
ncbi:hypothetical protein QYE76_071584 [Lolium multiflorum]|uniref:Peroxidase n=1 Tax=Lolium multiflorum TaxID=4521 RepID=A0AAD8WGZ2_LOLMU|nr:hypothetical protein QYE76_071584 [Lolium multiflorum]